MFFVACISHAFESVHCCLVVTCWERADLLALVGDFIVFLLLSHVVSCKVWYLIVWFPDLHNVEHVYLPGTTSCDKIIHVFN